MACKPDLCTLGKIVGGGTPLGAVAGRGDVMEQCDPRHKGGDGYVYQNGTLNGNPLSAAVALATLDELAKPGVYERLFEHSEALRAAIGEVLERHSMPAVCFGTGPMWHVLVHGPSTPHATATSWHRMALHRRGSTTSSSGRVCSSFPGLAVSSPLSTATPRSRTPRALSTRACRRLLSLSGETGLRAAATHPDSAWNTRTRRKRVN